MVATTWQNSSDRTTFLTHNSANTLISSFSTLFVIRMYIHTQESDQTEVQKANTIDLQQWYANRI